MLNVKARRYVITKTERTGFAAYVNHLSRSRPDAAHRSLARRSVNRCSRLRRRSEYFRKRRIANRIGSFNGQVEFDHGKLTGVTRAASCVDAAGNRRQIEIRGWIKRICGSSSIVTGRLRSFFGLDFMTITLQCSLSSIIGKNSFEQT